MARHEAKRRKLPQLDDSEPLPPTRMARWSHKVAGPAVNSFPIFASSNHHGRFNHHEVGQGAHVGTSASGAAHEAECDRPHRSLGAASLPVQHAVNLGVAAGSIMDLTAGSSIGLKSSASAQRLQSRRDALDVFRQERLTTSNASDAAEDSIFSRPPASFLPAGGAHRRAQPETVQPFRVPYAVKRPKSGSWQEWTDDAVQSLSRQRDLRIEAKRNQRQAEEYADRRVDPESVEEDALQETLEIEKLENEEPPIRLSIRKSQVLLQSLRQSRLLHMTSLLTPFSIRVDTTAETWYTTSQASPARPQVQPPSGQIDYAYICPLPPAISSNIDLRQPHILIQLGTADVRVGPHIFTGTRFWEFRPSPRRKKATNSTTTSMLQLPKDAATDPAPEAGGGSVSTTETSERPPRPPIIVIEFRENPTIRYVLPLWAAAVECRRFLQQSPGLGTTNKGLHELIMTFTVPALGSTARSHSEALIKAENAARHAKAEAKAKAAAKLEQERERAREEAARRLAEREAAEAAAQAASQNDQVIAAEDTTAIDAPEPRESIAADAMPTGITTRSRQNVKAPSNTNGSGTNPTQQPAPTIDGNTSVPTVRRPTPPPMPVTHPTLGLKNSDWLATWRLRGEGSLWTGFHEGDYGETVNADSFDWKELPYHLREAFGRVPGAVQFDMFVEEVKRAEPAAASKKRGRPRKADTASNTVTPTTTHTSQAGPQEHDPANSALPSTSEPLQQTSSIPAPPAVAAKTTKKTAKAPSGPAFKEPKGSQSRLIVRKVPSSSCWPEADPDELAAGRVFIENLTANFAAVLSAGSAERAYPVLSLDEPSQTVSGLKEEVLDSHRPRLQVHEEAPVPEDLEYDSEGDGWALVHS